MTDVCRVYTGISQYYVYKYPLLYALKMQLYVGLVTGVLRRHWNYLFLPPTIPDQTMKLSPCVIQVSYFMVADQSESFYSTSGQGDAVLRGSLDVRLRKGPGLPLCLV